MCIFFSLQLEDYISHLVLTDSMYLDIYVISYRMTVFQHPVNYSEHSGSLCKHTKRTKEVKKKTLQINYYYKDRVIRSK